MYNNREYQYVNITSAVTTQVFTGKGILHSVIINNIGSLGTITIADSTSATSPRVGIITLASSPAADKFYDVSISSGLRIVTSATPDITVTYTS